MTKSCNTLVLAILFLLASILSTARGSNPSNEHAQSTDLEENIREAALMQFVTTKAEDVLGVPRGHLHPAWAYHPAQAQTAMAHVQDPSSRFLLLITRDRLSFYATPWRYQRPGDAQSKRGVLFVQIWRGGHVVPAGHSGFEVSMPGTSRNFWQHIHGQATILQPDLVRTFGELRLLGA